MKHTNIKAVLFDFDGTLVNTEEISQKLYPSVYKHFGFKISKAQGLLLRSTGYPLKDQLYAKWYGKAMTKEVKAKLWDYFINTFDQYIAKHPIKLKQGTIDIFKYLKDKNIPIVIVSATAKDRIIKQMKQLDIYKYVSLIVSTFSVRLGKPNPDVYLYALKQLKLKAKDVIAVEDSPNGVISACRAKISTIMVPDLTYPTLKLRKAYKFKTVKCLSGIKKFVK